MYGRPPDAVAAEMATVTDPLKGPSLAGAAGPDALMIAGWKAGFGDGSCTRVIRGAGDLIKIVPVKDTSLSIAYG